MCDSVSRRDEGEEERGSIFIAKCSLVWMFLAIWKGLLSGVHTGKYFPEGAFSYLIEQFILSENYIVAMICVIYF